MATLNCLGTLVDLSTPKVMGIVNVTPDSFYDGGKSFSSENILRQTGRMLDEGATFIDIGGYSSRPGATDIAVSEETERVLRAIELILHHFPETIISIDTFRSEVARAAIHAGAAVINDISGGDLDARMMETVAELNVPFIMMHMRGNPKTMTRLTDYQNVTIDVIRNLSDKVRKAHAVGINDVVIDPGFGFAKTAAQSFELMRNLELFRCFEVPLLTGISRKSFIYKTLEISPNDALNGTTCMNTVALIKGSSILRVHDVKEAVQCIKLLENLKF
ncbi:MAG TPA: dihydropteroate synthase [Flavobacteriaceae bacterium]|nr:dihydropteroate synthase [Flavobacteriaceae bacterium]